MNKLLRKQDLENNPSTRVPICLCLDVSGSMDKVIRGKTRDTGYTEFDDGEEWNIVDGGVTALQEMIDGVNLFYEDLFDDEVARYSAEVCIVAFGGDSPELVMDFATLDRQEYERKEILKKLKARGETPMGEAVNMALDCLEQRKNEYKEVGVDYYQPWLVIMTDGGSNGSGMEFNRAVARTNKLINSSKLTIFPVGIGNEADMDCLAKFSPKQKPFRLKNMDFKVFFKWLSSSIKEYSNSLGEKLEKIKRSARGWEDF